MKTLKYMLSMVVSIAASCALADRVVDADYTLAADEDWSAAGRVLMADGVKIDLNGHSLKTSGFAEYIPVAYVETDGSQWVNTRYTPASVLAGATGNGDKVEIKFQMKDVEHQQFILCSRPSSGNNLVLYMKSNGLLNFGYRTVGGAGEYATNLEANQDYTVVIDYNSKMWSVNGNETNFSTTDSGKLKLDAAGPFALFCSHTAGTSLSDTTKVANMAKCRFYYMKVWDKDGNLKCDIIPAIGVNENALGLYDRVRGLFLKPVANEGAATAFANEYPEVDHLDTDGSLHVDTHFTPNHTNVLELSVRMMKTGETQGLFSTRNPNGKQSISLFAMSSNKFRFDHSTQHTYDTVFDTSTDYTLKAEPHVGDTKVHNYINGTKMGEETLATGLKPSYSLWLFNSRQGNTVDDNYASCRFYSFKAYDNKDDLNLVCDIVPVYSVSEKKFGLYDRVASRFLSPTGNDFKAPLDISIVNGSETKGTLETVVEGGNATTNSVVFLGDGIDYVKSGDGEWVCAKGLDVGGSFALNGGTVGGVTMQNESVLDFSARTTPLDLDTCGLAFASGATIYVAVGNRSITASAPLASWTAAPSGVTFRRDAAAPRRFSVWTTETGLYAAHRGLIISFH